MAARTARNQAGKARASRARRFRLDDHLFFYFTQILARRTRILNRDLAEFGLDYARWRVMAVVHDQGECSMGGLAELSSVDRTTLTRTVGQMEAEGLIAREIGAEDRRRVLLSLTRRGADLFERILPIVLELTDRALIGLSSGEVEDLRRRLIRMADNLVD